MPAYTCPSCKAPKYLKTERSVVDAGFDRWLCDACGFTTKVPQGDEPLPATPVPEEK